MGTEKDLFGKGLHYSMGKEDDLPKGDGSSSLEYRNFLEKNKKIMPNKCEDIKEKIDYLEDYSYNNKYNKRGDLVRKKLREIYKGNPSTDSGKLDNLYSILSKGEIINEKEEEFRHCNYLKNIHLRIKEIIPEDPRITLKSERKELRLVLDFGKGFETYEDFSLEYTGNLFEMKYIALNDTASQTFSKNSELFPLIRESKTLEGFLQQIIKEREVPEKYNSLLILDASGNYKEAEITTDFFSKAFSKKLCV